MRRAEEHRKTRETEITADLNLDGKGRADIDTGIGFLDHMLDQLSRHGLFDMTIRAAGDRHVDAHHTTEDVGIVLGRLFDSALGEKTGIRRYGSALAPMDEALTRAAVDLSGRAHLEWRVALDKEKIGEMDSELFRDFFIAFTQNARVTLHIETFYGTNSHHIVESVFKAVARTLRTAVEKDPRRGEAVPSTKGTLGEA